MMPLLVMFVILESLQSHIIFGILWMYLACLGCCLCFIAPASASALFMHAVEAALAKGARLARAGNMNQNESD